MTAYLNLRGMLETTLSLYSAGAALAGIGATLCWSTIHARLGALPLFTSPVVPLSLMAINLNTHLSKHHCRAYPRETSPGY